MSLAERRRKFNPNHEPAGSPAGGEFAPAGGSGESVAPDTLYHYTWKEFDAFHLETADSTRPGRHNPKSIDGIGHWMTDAPPENSMPYGPIGYAVHATIRHPYVVTNDPEARKFFTEVADAGGAKAWRAKQIAAGYDGVKFDTVIDAHPHTVWVAFHDSQVQIKRRWEAFPGIAELGPTEEARRNSWINLGYKPKAVTKLAPIKRRRLEKFNANHVPAGSPAGGQFAAAAAANPRAGRVYTNSNAGLWGDSHGNSYGIAAQAAKIMGISQHYVTEHLDDMPSGWRVAYKRQASAMLGALARSQGAGEKLYHGFSGDRATWKVGQIVDLSLTATTGGFDSAVMYAKTSIAGHPPTVFEFPPSTKIIGYSRHDIQGAKDLGYHWSEAIVGGRFKVTGVRVEPATEWDPPIRVVSMQPQAYFNPTSGKWNRAPRRIAKFNPNHEPAGSPVGGEFASSTGGASAQTQTQATGSAEAARTVATNGPAGAAAGASGPDVTHGNPAIQQIASQYVQDNQIETRALQHVTAVDVPAATRLAQTYDAAKSDPTNPQVIAAYRQLAKEVGMQKAAIEKAGYHLEFVNEDPYPNSRAMMQDVAQNHRLKVFKTEEDPAHPQQFHPMLTNAENNDFRGVHDFFGHARFGNQFGPIGEENAFRDHSAMFSPLARQALTTETRAQNSWFNFGPDAAMPIKQRRFADQKAVVLPLAWQGEYADMPGEVTKFNPNHEPAGSPAGGQFAVGGVDNMLAEWRATPGYQMNPFGGNEVITLHDGKYGGVRMRRWNNMAHIEDLRAVTRGGGRAALQHIVQLADKHSVKLNLNAEPLNAAPDGSGGLKMSPTRLRRWYKSFGFYHVGDGEMNRKPPGKILKDGPADESRDDHGRWTAGTSASEQFTGKPSAQIAHSRGILLQRMMDSAKAGGFTFNPRTGSTPTSGYVAGAFPRRTRIYDADKITLDHVKSFWNRNAQLFKNPNVHVGGWIEKNKQTGKEEIWLDPVRHYGTSPHQRRQAIAMGKRKNQISITDLGKVSAGDFEHAFIPTGGTGVGKADEAPTQEEKPTYMLWPASTDPAKVYADLCGYSVAKFSEREPRIPAGSPGGGRWTALTDANDSVLPINPKGTDAEKLAAIHRLTAVNKPILERAAQVLNHSCGGCKSKVSVKSDASILGKGSRPGILAVKPWHGVQHVRDTLRMKTGVDDIEQIPNAMAQAIKVTGGKIIKADVGKMMTPKEWGWRFSAIDERMPNGQMIEHYFVPHELDRHAIKDPNHLLFEKWRQKDTELTHMTPTERKAFRHDVRVSRGRYDAAWGQYLKRMHQTPLQARAAWARASARIHSIASASFSKADASGSSTIVQLSFKSSAPRGPSSTHSDPNNQRPVGSLTAIGSDHNQIRPSTSDRQAIGLPPVSSFMLPSSTGKILRRDPAVKSALTALARRRLRKDNPGSGDVRVSVPIGTVSGNRATVLRGAGRRNRRRIRRYQIGPILGPVLDSLKSGEDFYPHVVKGAEEQRLVVGWASVITNPDGTPLVDLQHDVIDEHELVLAAHGFFEHSRALGRQHEQTDGIGEVVEHFVLTKQARADLLIPRTVPTGWLIAAKVWDDPTWEGVKSGEFKGFSMGGTAIPELIPAA